MPTKPDNELLSDEELEKRIYDITQTMLVTLSEWQAGVTIDYHTAKQKGRAELFELVKSQKQAHANMVIGEDVNAIERDNYARIIKYDEKADHQNELRAEQRQRNSNHA